MTIPGKLGLRDAFDALAPPCDHPIWFGWGGGHFLGRLGTEPTSETIVGLSCRQGYLEGGHPTSETLEGP